MNTSNHEYQIQYTELLNRVRDKVHFLHVFFNLDDEEVIVVEELLTEVLNKFRAELRRVEENDKL